MTDAFIEQPGDQHGKPGFLDKVRQWLGENAVQLILYGIAFGGSFDHWMHLADRNGQTGLESLIAGVCVDLGVYRMTQERSRDARDGRGRKGWCSLPTLFLIGLVALTLAGNVASATHTAWGVIISLIPGAVLLMSIALMERRAAEDARRARARRAEVAADREARERQQQADQRQRERQQALSERHAHITGQPGQSVSSSSMTVSPGPMAPAPPNATTVMRAYWDREVAVGRTPTGADLLRAAGLPQTSSLGRQNAAKWRAELEQGNAPDGLRAVAL
jgi:hypothetical protein